MCSFCKWDTRTACSQTSLIYFASRPLLTEWNKGNRRSLSAGYNKSVLPFVLSLIVSRLKRVYNNQVSFLPFQILNPAACHKSVKSDRPGDCSPEKDCLWWHWKEIRSNHNSSLWCFDNLAARRVWPAHVWFCLPLERKRKMNCWINVWALAMIFALLRYRLMILHKRKALDSWFKRRIPARQRTKCNIIAPWKAMNKWIICSWPARSRGERRFLLSSGDEAKKKQTTISDLNGLCRNGFLSLLCATAAGFLAA